MPVPIRIYVREDNDNGSATPGKTKRAFVRLP